MKSTDFIAENRWAPFLVRDNKADPARGLASPEGVADRLRLVAFAELQARDAFRWGAERFAGQAPDAWRADWLRFAQVEDRHAQMLLSRMGELGVAVAGRAVTDKLTRVCHLADDPVLFLFVLSSAEERGMEAGFTLGQQMEKVDAASAAIFAQIAREEVEHVEMARSALAPYDPGALQERARVLSALL
jgi:uncharacterized ferritin-like protein (DUF455 family)